MTTPTRFAFTLSIATLIAACGSGSAPTSTTLGAAGGTVSTRTGITLRVPAGALSAPTQISIVESQPRDGAMAHLELEPHDLVLAVPASLTFKVEDGNVRLSEIEHGAEGEVRHELEKQRHDASGEVEVEVHHLGELEMEHGLTCDTACGTGFECDDGVCKADDDGVDPAAPGTPADDNGGTTPGHP